MERRDLTPVIPLTTLRRCLPDDEITPREIYGHRRRASANVMCREVKLSQPFDGNQNLAEKLTVLAKALEKLEEKGLTLHPYDVKEIERVAAVVKNSTTPNLKYRHIRNMSNGVSSHMLNIIKEWEDTKHIRLLSDIENFLSQY